MIDDTCQFRGKFSRVKTAKGRKYSSTKWIQRQINDPYVIKARSQGYRSRAAYKLIEINKKFSILKPDIMVVDLGAAPGGWSQIAAKITKSESLRSKSIVTAIDLLPIEGIEGVKIIQDDFQEEHAQEQIIKNLCGNKPDVIISDMAANTTGHAKTDHLRMIYLCEITLEFTLKNLKKGGHFVTKIFRGGGEKEFLEKVKNNFSKVKHFKPKSSRKESSEFYLIALNKK